MLPCIFIIGPPLSGKSTLAQNLAAKINFAHLDMNEIMLYPLHRDQHQQLPSSKLFISDFSPIECLNAIEQSKQAIIAKNNTSSPTAPPVSGLVLDGFPASELQLEEYLKVNPPPLAVFYVNVTAIEILKKRAEDEDSAHHEMDVKLILKKFLSSPPPASSENNINGNSGRGRKSIMMASQNRAPQPSASSDRRSRKSSIHSPTKSGSIPSSGTSSPNRSPLPNMNQRRGTARPETSPAKPPKPEQESTGAPDAATTSATSTTTTTHQHDAIQLHPRIELQKIAHYYSTGRFFSSSGGGSGGSRGNSPLSSSSSPNSSKRPSTLTSPPKVRKNSSPLRDSVVEGSPDSSFMIIPRAAVAGPSAPAMAFRNKSNPKLFYYVLDGTSATRAELFLEAENYLMNQPNSMFKLFSSMMMMMMTMQSSTMMKNSVNNEQQQPQQEQERPTSAKVPLPPPSPKVATQQLPKGSTTSTAIGSPKRSGSADNKKNNNTNNNAKTVSSLTKVSSFVGGVKTPTPSTPVRAASSSSTNSGKQNSNDRKNPFTTNTNATENANNMQKSASNLSSAKNINVNRTSAATSSGAASSSGSSPSSPSRTNSATKMNPTSIKKDNSKNNRNDKNEMIVESFADRLNRIEKSFIRKQPEHPQQQQQNENGETNNNNNGGLHMSIMSNHSTATGCGRAVPPDYYDHDHDQNEEDNGYNNSSHHHHNDDSMIDHDNASAPFQQQQSANNNQSQNRNPRSAKILALNNNNSNNVGTAAGVNSSVRGQRSQQQPSENVATSTKIARKNSTPIISSPPFPASSSSFSNKPSPTIANAATKEVNFNLPSNQHQNHHHVGFYSKENTQNTAGRITPSASQAGYYPQMPSNYSNEESGSNFILFTNNDNTNAGDHPTTDGNGYGNDDDDDAQTTLMIASEKQRAQKARQQRVDYFADVAEFSPTLRSVSHKDVRCGWLGCASLALSYVSGDAISVEDILRLNRMSLHYVSLAAVTTAELCDTVDEFIQLYFHSPSHPLQQQQSQQQNSTIANNNNNSNRNIQQEESNMTVTTTNSGNSAIMVTTTTNNNNNNNNSTTNPQMSSNKNNDKPNPNLSNNKIRSELIMFDSDVVQEDDEDPEVARNTDTLASTVGQRPPIRSLAEFRKFVANELTNAKSMLALNFDPFVIQNHLKKTETNFKNNNNSNVSASSANANSSATQNSGSGVTATAGISSSSMSTASFSTGNKNINNNNNNNLQDIHAFATVSNQHSSLGLDDVPVVDASALLKSNNNNNGESYPSNPFSARFLLGQKQNTKPPDFYHRVNESRWRASGNDTNNNNNNNEQNSNLLLHDEQQRISNANSGFGKNSVSSPQQSINPGAAPPATSLVEEKEWSSKNQGAFALLLRYIEVKQSVVIGIPYFCYDEEVHLAYDEHVRSMQRQQQQRNQKSNSLNNNNNNPNASYSSMLPRRRRTSSSVGQNNNNNNNISNPSNNNINNSSSTARPGSSSSTQYPFFSKQKRSSSTASTVIPSSGDNNNDNTKNNANNDDDDTVAISAFPLLSNFRLHTIECPLQVLYDSICVVDGYTKRRRGLVRIYIPLQEKLNPYQNLEQLMRRRRSSSELPSPGQIVAFCQQNNSHNNNYYNFEREKVEKQQEKQDASASDNSNKNNNIPSCFPLHVIDGRNSSGMLSVSLDVTISPHILGLSLLHHLVQSTFLQVYPLYSWYYSATLVKNNLSLNNHEQQQQQQQTDDVFMQQTPDGFSFGRGNAPDTTPKKVNFGGVTSTTTSPNNNNNNNRKQSLLENTSFSSNNNNNVLYYFGTRNSFTGDFPAIANRLNVKSNNNNPTPHISPYSSQRNNNKSHGNTNTNNNGFLVPTTITTTMTTGASPNNNNNNKSIPNTTTNNNNAPSSLLSVIPQKPTTTATTATTTTTSRSNGDDDGLRGIPVTDICQTLELPIGAITSRDCNSLEVAASWYAEYLRRKRLDADVKVGVARLHRRGNTEDGAVNVTQDELADIFAAAVLVDNNNKNNNNQQQQNQRTVTSPTDIQAVILVNFDINIASNVVINANSFNYNNNSASGNGPISPATKAKSSSASFFTESSNNNNTSPNLTSLSQTNNAPPVSPTSAATASSTTATTTETHFAVVVGYDPRTQIVKLADVNVKKFRKVWHTTLPRLHAAMVGYGGFMIAASATRNNLAVFLASNNHNYNNNNVISSPASSNLKASPNASLIFASSTSNNIHSNQLAATSSALTATDSLFGNSIVAASFQRAAKLTTLAVRFALPPNKREYTMAPRFEFPKRNFSVTPLANALCCLGIRTTVEDMLYGSGYDVSFMLSEHLPLLCLESIVSYFCFLRRDNVAHVNAFVLDPSVTFSDEDFISVIKASVKCDSCKRVVVNFHPASLQRHSEAWNGSVCANTALVIGYDDTTRRVILEDSNPEPFYRTWACSVAVLMELMREDDTNSTRPRGFLEIVRGPDTSREGTNGVDLRRSMLHHPFKTTVSSVACGIALAVSEVARSTAYSAEDVHYAASSNLLSLVTLSQQLVMDQCVELAEQFLQSDPYLRATVKVEAVRRAQWTKMPVAEYNKLLTVPHAVVMLIYKPAVIFPRLEQSVTTLGGGIVTKVEAGRIHIVDGDLTKRGRTWHKLVERVLRGTAGVLIFQRRI